MFPSLALSFLRVKRVEIFFDAGASVLELDHPLEGKVRQLASPFRLSDTPPTFRRFAPVLGEHSVEVLQSIGYSENEIGALEKAGVVRAQNFRP